jgi:hypothetical protein
MPTIKTTHAPKIIVRNNNGVTVYGIKTRQPFSNQYDTIWAFDVMTARLEYAKACERTVMSLTEKLIAYHNARV